jgi:hypothetical protein
LSNSTTKALEFNSYKEEVKNMSKANDVDIHYQKKDLQKKRF